MSAGKPVISNDKLGGTKEIITNNINGYIIDKYDINQAEDIILNLLDNNDESIRIGNNAKKIINEQFLIEKMGKKYELLYLETANK